MLLFTFVYEDNPGESRNNRIEIDEGLFKRIAGVNAGMFLTESPV
jgi:hypothetical protein